MSAATVTVIGGGPAGAAAALAALAEGAGVRILEKSRFPRHKVCGEFLSPEVAGELDGLGAWGSFGELRPARLEGVALHFGRREKRWKLPAPAWGLSRAAFDQLLLEKAVGAGAEVRREPGESAAPAARPGAPRTPLPAVMAQGRRAVSRKGGRLFGFKAHFNGPADDAVELFFFPGGYVGVSAVEGGVTNVCGLAPEPMLERHSFEIERLLAGSEQLARRLAPLRRAMDWLVTGPLVFGHGLPGTPHPGVYPAGDTLGFVDPFTGSGILSALVTGRLAGIAAVRGLPAGEHLGRCRRGLGRQYGIAGLLRQAVKSGLAERLAGFVPGRWLLWATRPGV